MKTHGDLWAQWTYSIFRRYGPGEQLKVKYYQKILDLGWNGPPAAVGDGHVLIQLIHPIQQHVTSSSSKGRLTYLAAGRTFILLRRPASLSAPEKQQANHLQLVLLPSLPEKAPQVPYAQHEHHAERSKSALAQKGQGSEPWSILLRHTGALPDDDDDDDAADAADDDDDGTARRDDAQKHGANGLDWLYSPHFLSHEFMILMSGERSS